MSSSAYAIMDIGSNAVRFLWGKPDQLKNKRIALRLGEDSFRKGMISKKLTCRLKKAVQEFSSILESKEIAQYRVIATSALREAFNGPDVVEFVEKKTNIKIEMISAEEEARLIQLAVCKHMALKKKKALLVDIGGGSAEYVVLDNEELVQFFTSPLGTVRLIQDIQFCGEEVGQRTIEEIVEERIKGLFAEIKGSFVRRVDSAKAFVATGGNPRALGRLAYRQGLEKEADSVSLESLEELVSTLDSMSYEQRMKKLGLSADRADVILPAAIVLLQSMKRLRFKRMNLPPVGLKEGLIIDMMNK